MKKIFYALVTVLFCCFNLVLTVAFINIVYDEDADSVLGKMASFGELTVKGLVVTSPITIMAFIGWVIICGICGRWYYWVMLGQSWLWLPVVCFLEITSYFLLIFLIGICEQFRVKNSAG